MPLESCNIVFDRVRMSQVLTNFCTNAIKFTKKGKITLGYEVLDNELKLFVKDSGYGISEANKHKVFERFERFNRSEPGTGLGLYICKSIAEEAGGKIGFESKEGVGSTFWVKLKCIQD